MQNQDRINLFNRWAQNYDPASMPGTFPFSGYDAVLDGIASLCNPQPNQLVLDLGIGTGNLAQRFHQKSCTVYGVDFSSEMLQKIGFLPDSQLIQADLLNPLPDNLPTFDHIISAYVLHEFPQAQKIAILTRMADRLKPTGKLIIGDIAFPTQADHDQIDGKDPDEYYWITATDIPALETAGFAVQYQQISVCAGIFQISK